MTRICRRFRAVACLMVLGAAVLPAPAAATDTRVERVIVPTEGRRRYCMYRSNCAGKTAPLPEPAS